MLFSFYFSVVGCRSNNDCADKQACLNRECLSPCDQQLCARNEICDVTGHVARCLPSKSIKKFFTTYLTHAILCYIMPDLKRSIFSLSGNCFFLFMRILSFAVHDKFSDFSNFLMRFDLLSV